jgi:hypothetical protein
VIHNGAPFLLVTKRLGHAALSMTLDRYGWLHPSADVPGSARSDQRRHERHADPP